MKKLYLFLILSLCMFILFACQSQEEKMTLLDNINSISVSESDGYGGINEEYFTTIDKDTFVSRFERVLKRTEGRKQNVDVENEKPDYDVLVQYKNGETHGLHLSLGDSGKKSRIMYIGHENNGFDISPEDTDILRAMLND